MNNEDDITTQTDDFNAFKIIFDIFNKIEEQPTVVEASEPENKILTLSDIIFPSTLSSPIYILFERVNIAAKYYIIGGDIPNNLRHLPLAYENKVDQNNLKFMIGMCFQTFSGNAKLNDDINLTGNTITIVSWDRTPKKSSNKRSRILHR